MAGTNGLMPEDIKLIRETISKIEDRESQKQELAAETKSDLEYCKVRGINPKTIRKIVALRKKTRTERELEQDEVDLYMAAVEE